MTLQEAADRLEVHYMTAYRYVRLGLLPTRKVGGTWRISAEAIAEFRAGGGAGSSPGEAPWADRLEARMHAGDTTAAWAVVEAALTSGAEPADMHEKMVGPALVSVGERWASGELSVADEHIASAVAATAKADAKPARAEIRRDRYRRCPCLGSAPTTSSPTRP